MNTKICYMFVAHGRREEIRTRYLFGYQTLSCVPYCSSKYNKLVFAYGVIIYVVHVN